MQVFQQFTQTVHIFTKLLNCTHIILQLTQVMYILKQFTHTYSVHLFMPPKELWEAYSNRTVRPSVRQSVRPAFVSGPYLLYSLR